MLKPRAPGLLCAFRLQPELVVPATTPAAIKSTAVVSSPRIEPAMRVMVAGIRGSMVMMVMMLVVPAGNPIRVLWLVCLRIVHRIAR